MKHLILAIVLLLLNCTSWAQHYRIDRKLQRQLEALVKPFHGQVGIYVHKLGTRKEAAINADSLFPTASMIKVAIQAVIFQRIVDSQLQYHQNLLYRDSLYYPGVDILGMAKDSTHIELSKVVMLMITESDNTAALWLQSLAGGGTAINQWLAKHGYQYYRVNSRTPGREKAYQEYGWGQTTPREMARFLIQLRRGELVSPAASERMYRNLCHIYWDDVALSQIPPYVQAASKQGAVNDSRSEVVLVNAPHGDYVFCVDTKNIADQSWTHNNEAWQLIRNVSALLWHYYEPHDTWSPPAGYEQFMQE
ncbi:MAG: class A beta-lactamase-related serine hydrolase [Thermoflavifilum sp.]|nr:class A beta-lactamase-related serine hydrolase [Thermoflavifilum sp.]